VKILVIHQGIYGQRIVDNIKARGPKGWLVNSWLAPAVTEPVVDEPELYLREKVPAADLVIHLAETPQAAQLLPELVRRSGAKAVIASIDSSAWIPLGLRNQLRRELERQGVTIVFPEPLCSLDVETVGYGETVQPYTSKTISEFCRYFGKPILDVDLDEKGIITEAKVLRGAPCGSTEYTVGRVKGLAGSKAVPAAGLMCLHYPCLASMKFEQTENGVDTIMHNSGRIFNEGMAKALKKRADKRENIS